MRVGHFTGAAAFGPEDLDDAIRPAWFLRARYGYAAPMIALIVALLLVWLVILIVGLVVKGLFWLFVIGAILFVATAIVLWVRRRV
ncbi:hypothetical protein AB0C02_24445 [Micromonospora sp. NPDC048999]|uniref:hypothetical protein n=1 Tax=Micromonospora sp. NPDC048999 TaxID=3155391 RepID=UPI0033D23099